MLDGRVIIVTGAGRGLGKAYALAAAAEGATVVVNDIDGPEANETVDEIQGSGGKAAAHVGSAAEWPTAEGLIGSTIDQFGQLDGLVNNAGLFDVRDPWDEDEASLRRLFEVNTLGVLFPSVHALRHMVSERRGSIVNITSGSHAGMPQMATYGASKGAVASWTYCTAIDAMPHNVRVNAVSPVGRTRMGDVRGTGPRPDLPLPEHVAPLIVYLLSDLAAGITGQVVRLARGQLSIVEHPASVEPNETDEHWTPQSIADAFERLFRGQLRPLGQGATEYRWTPEA